ncbi:ribonuclease [Bacillus thuringiensis]|uniref:ribonuclease n=1 Tax=Bacillus thuringiensis TaxID=1428 RepID=UPI00125EF19E|nr:ribonuclease [Bacillus thuringiensis]KAB5654625.1 ribonuclease [Bacillus thuringiensis]HDR5271828.1 ribonuclease [Bacillus thuringiensis]
MKKPFYKKWWFWFIAVIVAIGIIGNIGSKKEETTKVSTKVTKEPLKEETKSEAKDDQPRKSVKEFKEELKQKRPVQNENGEKLQPETKKEEPVEQEQPKQEETKTNVNSDKNTYENEIKPKINTMIKEYDEIWNQEWKPVWTEISSNIQSADPNTLKEKMELISSKYDALSKKNSEFKVGEKLTDSTLKEKIEKFRVEFGLATNYRSNAANAVRQGVQGVAPMKGRMEEAKKSIKLSDQKIINASVNLVEVESKLGIQHN